METNQSESEIEIDEDVPDIHVALSIHTLEGNKQQKIFRLQIFDFYIFSRPHNKYP